MSQTVQVFPSQPKETRVSVRDLISVNLALSETLAQETQMMESMQIEQVGALQDRKLKLINLMERYTRYLHQHPEVLANITPEERRDLQRAGEIFRDVARKNYDKLLVARAVNRVVVDCVKQEVSRRSHNATYGSAGAVVAPSKTPLSFTLNQTA